MERFPLNVILSPLSYEERVKVQENWNRISSYFNGLQQQINILAGNQEVDVLLQRITDAITAAETTVEELAALMAQLELKLTEIQTAITNANNAADDANTLNIALTRLKGELEALQTTLSGIVQTEAQRVANEDNRVIAEQGRETAESSRVISEAARETAEQQRVTAEQGRVSAEQNRVTTFDAKMLTAEQKITMIQYLIDNLASYNYDPAATFNFPNLIKWNGSTFIALKEVTGVTPVDDGINYRLVAQRGVDGTGAVSSVNGMGPDADGNVEVIMSLVNNLVSDSTTAGLTAAQGKVLKVLLDGLQQAFNAHANAVDNPHQVTAEQIALGNVQNFGVATQAEAESGTENDKYMTPQRTKQSFDKNITTFSDSLEQLEMQVTTHLDDTTNVKLFGAVGDGITDDTVSVKSAISNCKTKGGGIIYFPKGTYLISSSLLLPSNVTLLGQGKNLSTIQFDQNITLTGQSFGGTQRGLANEELTNQYISLKNLSFKGTGATQVGACSVAFVGVSHLVIENCMFENFGNDSLYQQGLVVFASSSVIITNNNFYFNSGDGLAIADGNSDVICSNNISFANKDYGIAVTANVNRATITNNDCTSNGQNGIGVDSCIYITVIGNNCIANGRAGIELLRFGTTVPAHPHYNYVVNGNTCAGNVTGITVSHCSLSIITDNIIQSNEGQGINISGSQELLVADNIIKNNSNEGILLISYANGTTKDNQINGNSITGNIYGIRELNSGGTIESSSIFGNKVQGNITANYLLEVSKFQGIQADTGNGVIELKNGYTNYDVNLKTTTASAGTANQLPATPSGYLSVMIDGVLAKIPYYNS